ncbi:hypothetical protein Hte_007629 [Hypoxylon texense]
MAPRKRHITLGPTTGDQFPLPKDRIVKSQFEELFTFTTFETEQIDYTRRQEGPDDEDDDSSEDDEDDEATLGSSDHCTTSATSGTQLPASDLAVSDSLSSETDICEDDSGEDDSSGDSSNVARFGNRMLRARFLVVPGHPPSIRPFFGTERTFTLPDSLSMDTPSLPFEDLCRAAMGEDKLDAIRSASFVTDAETLWALFSTLHDKVIGSDYRDQSFKGITILAHTVEGTTFMKVINIEEIDGFSVKSATAHLKKHRLTWCWTENSEDSPPPRDMDAFRRVISYNFGDLKIVVEDGNQVLSCPHECDKLEDEGSVKAFEPWVWQPRCQPDDDTEDGPAFTVKRPTKEISHESTALFAYGQASSHDNDVFDRRVMAHLWFSETRRAMLTFYKQLLLWHTTARFSGEIETLDTGATEISDDDDSDSGPESAPGEPGSGLGPGSHEAGTPPMSIMDTWAERYDIAETFQLLHRLLKHVEKTAEDQAGEYNHNFLLRHKKKTSLKMDVVSSDDRIVSLISPRMVYELQAAAADGDSEECEEYEESKVEVEEKEQEQEDEDEEMVVEDVDDEGEEDELGDR